MKAYLDHFKQIIPVSETLQQEIVSRSSCLTLPKGSFLHEANSICSQTYWIEKGLLRTFYLKDGKEITDIFAAENQWITSMQSFMRDEPDQYYLQAIEEATVYALSKNDMMHLFQNFHEMEKFGRVSMSDYYIQLSEKLASYQFTTAKEKYHHFCHVYRKILHRLPLGMIASYIGITQETLSRIRKKT